MVHCIAGIDMALWDLLGKSRGEPVYRLLGYETAFPKIAYASQLFGDDPHLPRASRNILNLGPDAIIIKRGEYGAALLNNAGWFFVPGYPLENVVDPTGAGDSFAGAFLGSVAEAGTITNTVLRRAVVFGSIVASFTVEAFGVDRLMSLTRDEIDARYAEFRQFVAY